MRRWFAALLGLALVAAVIVAATAEARTTKKDAVTVTLAGWSAGADEDDLLRQVVAKFEKTHPGIKVDYSVINGDYPTAMTARFAAHNPPDVFYVDSSLAPTWAKEGVLQPLNSYIKSSKYDTSAFFPSLLGAFTVGSTIYGFPKDWSPLAMEIDTGLLGAAHAKVPKTWSQLETAAKQLQSAGVVKGGKPICLSADWARMLAFVYQNKGSLANIQSPAVKQAVDFYVGLIKKGLATTPDKLGSGWCGEALGKQKAAIIFEGNWVLPFMKSTYPGIAYGVFPMVGNKTGGNLAFTVSYSMAKDAKNKPAAWTLLSWLTGQAGQKLWVSKGLALPSRKDVKALKGRKNFLDAAKYAHGWGFDNFSNAYTIMNNDLTAVINGSKSVDQMLSEAASALKG
ncbi:MAG TPA: ABC transporter substrate-binding protein [Gaiellaceae bacterium]|jgi:multiple sugar transport system substrate-binding protein|nr:ABC transporter substrate-binding protein [Gaiellaceae bacterium]